MTGEITRAKVRRTTRRARATVRRVMFGFKDVCSYKNILQIFQFADAVDDEQLLYENLNHAFPTRGLDCAIAVISEPCYYMQWIERMKHRSRTRTRTRVVELHRTTPLRRIMCTNIFAFFSPPSSRGASCEDKSKAQYFVTKTSILIFDKFSRENLSKVKIFLRNPEFSWNPLLVPVSYKPLLISINRTN